MSKKIKDNHIGLLNEKSLHAAIKKWYARPGDRLEEKIGRYVIDIVRDNHLIEIQTKYLYKIKKKILKLSEDHLISLVYPIPKNKWIVRLDNEGNEINRRKLPKSGNIINIFDELVRIPELINNKNISIEVLLISEELILKNDGLGSWRRKWASVEDHKLLDVHDRVVFKTRADFKRFLPDNLIEPFTNSSLANTAEISRSMATKITYSLKRMGLLKPAGKIKRELLYVKSL